MAKLFIIAGPNGAGKTTLAMTLLPEFLGCNEFVNADAIAAGLSPLNADEMALQAGRLMLQRIKQLAKEKKDFVFETTLATRSYAPFIKQLRKQGYETNLIFLWLETPELALQRVRLRVKSGGHDVPEDVVRRRYKRGMKNLMHLYVPLVDKWRVFDNSLRQPRIIAEKRQDKIKVHDKTMWQIFEEEA